MPGFVSPQAGIAASIFLALYTLYTVVALAIVSRIGLRTSFTLILVFGVLRVGGQLCGVAFAKLGYKHWQWLIAYLVLTAEGYFTLVLVSFHFIARAQRDVTGSSWLRPTAQEVRARNEGKSVVARRLGWYTPSRVFHLVLIPANALLIAGGSMLAGIDPDQYASLVDKINTSKALRCVGQAGFLLETLVALYFAIYVFTRERVRTYVIYALFCAFPFLVVRGIFGVMSIFISKMNYFALSNYTEHGFSTYFVVCEYVMATTMEFCAACILLTIHLHDHFHRHTERHHVDEESSKEER